MKIKCIIVTKSYNSKPQGNEAGGIINRMKIDTEKDYLIDDIKKRYLKDIQ